MRNFRPGDSVTATHDVLYDETWGYEGIEIPEGTQGVVLCDRNTLVKVLWSGLPRGDYACYMMSTAIRHMEVSDG